MFINLENVFNNGVGEIKLDYEFDFSDKEYDGMYPFTTPVKVHGVVKNETDIVYIKAVADFELNAVCDRCAGDFSRQMSVAVDHILVSQLNDESNDEFILVEGMNLALDELVMEDIYLSLPMRLLCKEDCKGICSKCGKNLNEGSCDCKKEVDPRLKALQQLLEN